MNTFEGGCTCRAVRYRMNSGPLFVHCCHCSWCQRETGTAFALNAMIETVHLAPGVPVMQEYYKASEHWPKESLERRAALMAKK